MQVIICKDPAIVVLLGKSSRDSTYCQVNNHIRKNGDISITDKVLIQYPISLSLPLSFHSFHDDTLTKTEVLTEVTCLVPKPYSDNAIV